MTAITSLRPTRRVVSAGLVGALALGCGIALTATSGWLIVRASEEPQILLLLTAIVAVRAFGMFRPVLRYAERLLSHDAALADLAERRTALFAALLPLSPGRLGARARSEVLTHVADDLTDVSEASVRVTVPATSALGAGLLAAALTALVQPAVGLVLLAMVALLALGSRVALALESGSSREVLAARGEVTRVAELVSRQAEELRAIGATVAALGWLDDAHDVLRRATRRQSRGRGLVAAWVLAVTGVATAVSAFAAADAGLSGPMTALLLLTPVAVGEAVAGVTDAARALVRARGAAERIEDLLAQPPAVRPEPDSGPTRGQELPDGARRVATSRPEGSGGVRLTLAGVTAEWVPGRGLLAPVDLDLRAGSRTAFVGANGSGKSTLLAVLARHLDPATGAYEVDGTDVRDLGVGAVRALVAVVDDEPHVFAASLRENLRLACPDAEDGRIVRALTDAGLGDWVAGLADGLDTRLGASGLGMSGGERARLGLARALLSGRPVILLDEPVAHLDHATAVSVLADVERATRGATVVMVSHRPEGIDGFDDVVHLGAGRSGQ